MRESFWQKFLGLCLNFLAEKEDMWTQDAKPIIAHGKWRKKWLERNQVVHGRMFCTRPGLLIFRRGNLEVGDRVSLGFNTQIYNHGPISIGDDFLAASCLILNSGTHDPETLQPLAAPIRIGNRVWCGERVTILAGVTIGDDVVIGAGSVVTKNVESKSVVAGVPAKKIRSLLRPQGGEVWTPYAKNQHS